MSPQSRGTDLPAHAVPTRKMSEQTDKVAGLGILSIDPAARARSYTIDSLNISPIDSYREPRHGEDYGAEFGAERSQNETGRLRSESDTNWEKATWQFSDILQSISGKDREDMAGLLSKCNRLVPLLAEHPSLQKEIVVENVIFKVQFMLYDGRAQVRSAAYRLLRHAMATPEAVMHLVRSKILIFLIVSLSTPTPMLEKEEALKMVRQFTSISGGVDYLSVGVVKALVAYIENENDENQTDSEHTNESYSYTRMCIETIAEIAVLKPDIAFHSGGLRLLINLTINGAADVSISILPTILTLLDMPHSRLFLRNGADLDCLMSVYTLFEDDDTVRAPHSKKYHHKAMKMAFILSCLLKTWSGLICFSHDNFAPVKMLLSNLRKRNNKLRGILLDLLLDILRIQHLSWLEDSNLGDLLAQMHAQYRQNGIEEAPAFEYAVMDPKSFEYGIVSHYQGLLTKVLINCGLVPLLFNIVDEDRDPENTQKATRLLTEVFELCSKCLPSEFFDTHILKAYNADLSLTSLGKIEAATRMRQNKLDEARNSDVRSMVKDLTQKSRMEMKDSSFKALIAGTKVLTVKEFEDWNWSLLSQLFQGPLRSPTRFAELQDKYPKFLKTVLSFLRPFKYRFSSVPITASSRFPKIRKPKYIMSAACQLIEGLLATEEGSKFLSSNKLMPQLAEIFAQIDPHSGTTSKDPILAKRRLEHSLSLGYVKMVGVMSGAPRGIRILDQWQLFHMMCNILETSSKDDTNNSLIFNILSHLDYSSKGHARAVLGKALTVSNWKVKIYTLEHVLPILCTIEGCEQFYVHSLVNLLDDATSAVIESSVECLYQYFICKDNLSRIDLLVDRRPSVAVLEQSSQGKHLLLKLCTTSQGFKYLEENGYIEEKFMQSIEQLQTLDYLSAVEDSLRRHLFPFTPAFPHPESEPTLRHFFHYLLSTEEGFNYLNARRSYVNEAVSGIRGICRILNILDETCDTDEYTSDRRIISSAESKPGNLSFISNESPIEMAVTPKEFKHWPLSSNWAKSAESIFEDGSSESRPSFSPNEMAAQDDEYLLKRLKQYIWMVGEIASARYGIQILEPVYSPTPTGGHIAETLSLIFEKASHWQLRGLAFFQLGKMAGTVEGVEILDELHWISLDSREKYNLSLAYPKFMQEDGFTKVEVSNPYNDVSYFSLFANDEDIHVNGNLDLEDEIVIESFEESDEKILTLFNYLSSVLGRIERKATKELTRVKNEKPQVFSNPNLFLKTIRLIDKGKFKFRTRSFIFSLFNTMRVLEGLVKRDRKNSSVKRQPI
ncbi:hypothetical protein OXX69_005354 [Metschnikowia pulcherrima]